VSLLWDSSREDPTPMADVKTSASLEISEVFPLGRTVAEIVGDMPLWITW